jgi:hypothetical protein
MIFIQAKHTAANLIGFQSECNSKWRSSRILRPFESGVFFFPTFQSKVQCIFYYFNSSLHPQNICIYSRIFMKRMLIQEDQNVFVSRHTSLLKHTVDITAIIAFCPCMFTSTEGKIGQCNQNLFYSLTLAFRQF